MKTALVGGVDVPTGHYIGGAWVDTAATFETHSPLDWEAGPLATISRGDSEAAAAAVDAAVIGFETWGSFTVHERAEVMHRLADLIEANNEQIAMVETLDMGFMYESMRQRLVARGALNLSLIHISEPTRPY